MWKWVFRMNRKYIFEDFQLDDIGDREEVNMECGITIPIRSIADLPTDIAKIVNGSVSQTMRKFEKKYGKVSDISTLRLTGYLQVDENGSNKHYIGLIIFDNVGLTHDARTDIYIKPNNACYLDFARYCANKLNQYLFAI